MISKTVKIKGGEYVIEPDGRLRAVQTLYGLSTDEKPTEDVKDSDRYFEKNTANMAIFDEETKTWYPI